jgi:hypothetical protein
MLDLLQKRLAHQRRKALVKEITEVRQEYSGGQVKFGSHDEVY